MTTRPRWMDLNADEAPEDAALPVEVRVKQGMALLDEKHGPDWVQRIDVDTLNLASSCDCVIGQLYDRRYTVGVIDLGVRDETPAHGFVCGADADDCTCGTLTTAWRSAILARRLEQAQ